MDWRAKLDLSQAVRNLRSLAKGDWYRDPWGWPEYQHLLDTAGDAAWKRLRATHGSRAASPIEVPKENFGVRPAVQLDILDHVIYQMLVDAVSADILGDLRADVFGWRHPPGAAKAGRYSWNSFQWLNYRTRLSRLAESHDFALKTDVTSFFGSIPIDGIVEELSVRTGEIAIIDRLEAMLGAWGSSPGSSGLPQRSLASSVLANMYMQHADEIVAEHAVPPGGRRKGGVGRCSFTRWMDDIWLFNPDRGTLRAAQVDLQRELRSMGLVLNSGKTELLEGATMRAKAKKADASAVEAAHAKGRDSTPLEDLIDRILDEKETADGTTVKFVSTRMRKWKVDYRLPDILAAAERFPHAADSLARLFRRRMRSGDVQEWYLHYLGSRWNCFEWASAQFGTAIPSTRPPRRTTIDAFETLLTTGTRSLPGVALAAQRLAAWEPRKARELIAGRVEDESDPLVVRTLALSALQAGERPATVRRWLRPFPETQLTAQMLAARGFTAPTVTKDFR